MEETLHWAEMARPKFPYHAQSLAADALGRVHTRLKGLN
jgi:hypothetical protein